MRVLFVTGIFPPDHGGPATHVPLVAHGMQARGHDIVGIVTLSDSLNHDRENAGLPVTRILRNQPRAARMLQTMGTIRRLAAHADVVYCTGLLLETALACRMLGHRNRLVARIGGDPVWERACNQGLYDSDMTSFQSVALPFKLALIRRLHWLNVGMADQIVVPSRFLACIVSYWLPKSTPVAVIPNACRGYHEDSAAATPRFDIVTVARLTPFKGIAGLIEVAAKNGWSLKIVGDGPLRSSLEQLAKNASRGMRCPNIVFTGHVPSERIIAEMEAADIFVLNSVSEGMPNAVVEAKHCGLPVVCTAVGGCVDIVRDGIDGYLIPPGDSGQLERRIAELLAAPQLRQSMAREGRRDARARYSAQRLIDETEAVLQARLT